MLLSPRQTTAEEPVKLPSREQFHLYLLVGQSNMAGRGKVTAADKTPHPRVLMFDKAGAWVPAVDPLHFDKPGVVGVGLGKTFAMELADANPDVTIGLIPCAVGGSPIDTWSPGGYHAQTKSHPWDDMLKRAKAALPHGTLKGILWHQGESDANEKLAPEYAAKLQNLVSRFRQKLEAPDVPFIVGQMGQFPESPWNEDKRRVDTAHRELPEHVPHVAFVSSDGLGHRGDKVHFSAEAYRELGKRYARAYLNLTQPATKR
ncbi:MAG: sialate O-acetylesterase [Planctomycetaceae bacterium]|nr:sialate O-acetylesterase [Planctomycetaceae bacterium]